jgi:hypothetical protein
MQILVTRGISWLFNMSKIAAVDPPSVLHVIHFGILVWHIATYRSLESRDTVNACYYVLNSWITNNSCRNNIYLTKEWNILKTGNLCTAWLQNQPTTNWIQTKALRPVILTKFPWFSSVVSRTNLGWYLKTSHDRFFAHTPQIINHIYAILLCSRKLSLHNSIRICFWM